MMPTAPEKMQSPWLRLGAEIPAELGEASVLLVGPEAGRDAVAPSASEVVGWEPAVDQTPPTGPFGLVVCARAIEATAHPANLLTVLCDLMPPGAGLLLHSRVLTDPKLSAYARFVGGKAEWVPGRLALRWTVETNGFDVEHWIDAGPSEPGGEADAYLAAVRSERYPALILGTPVPVDGPKPAPESE